MLNQSESITDMERIRAVLHRISSTHDFEVRWDSCIELSDFFMDDLDSVASLLIHLAPQIDSFQKILHIVVLSDISVSFFGALATSFAKSDRGADFLCGELVRLIDEVLDDISSSSTSSNVTLNLQQAKMGEPQARATLRCCSVLRSTAYTNKECARCIRSALVEVQILPIVVFDLCLFLGDLPTFVDHLLYCDLSVMVINQTSSSSDSEQYGYYKLDILCSHWFLLGLSKACWEDMFEELFATIASSLSHINECIATRGLTSEPMTVAANGTSTVCREDETTRLDSSLRLAVMLMAAAAAAPPATTNSSSSSSSFHGMNSRIYFVNIDVGSKLQHFVRILKESWIGSAQDSLNLHQLSLPVLAGTCRKLFCTLLALVLITSQHEQISRTMNSSEVESIMCHMIECLLNFSTLPANRVAACTTHSHDIALASIRQIQASLRSFLWYLEVCLLYCHAEFLFVLCIEELSLVGRDAFEFSLLFGELHAASRKGVTNSSSSSSSSKAVPSSRHIHIRPVHSIVRQLGRRLWNAFQEDNHPYLAGRAPCDQSKQRYTPLYAMQRLATNFHCLALPWRCEGDDDEGDDDNDDNTSATNKCAGSSSSSSCGANWLACWTLALCSGSLIFHIAAACTGPAIRSNKEDIEKDTPITSQSEQQKQHQRRRHYHQIYIKSIMQKIIQEYSRSFQPHPWLVSCIDSWVERSVSGSTLKIVCSSYITDRKSASAKSSMMTHLSRSASDACSRVLYKTLSVPTCSTGHDSSSAGKLACSDYDDDEAPYNSDIAHLRSGNSYSYGSGEAFDPCFQLLESSDEVAAAISDMCSLDCEAVVATGIGFFMPSDVMKFVSEVNTHFSLQIIQMQAMLTFKYLTIPTVSQPFSGTAEKEKSNDEHLRSQHLAIFSAAIAAYAVLTYIEKSRVMKQRFVVPAVQCFRSDLPLLFCWRYIDGVVGLHIAKDSTAGSATSSTAGCSLPATWYNVRAAFKNAVTVACPELAFIRPAEGFGTNNSFESAHSWLTHTLYPTDNRHCTGTDYYGTVGASLAAMVESGTDSSTVLSVVQILQLLRCLNASHLNLLLVRVVAPLMFSSPSTTSTTPICEGMSGSTREWNDVNFNKSTAYPAMKVSNTSTQLFIACCNSLSALSSADKLTAAHIVQVWSQMRRTHPNAASFDLLTINTMFSTCSVQSRGQTFPAAPVAHHIPSFDVLTQEPAVLLRLPLSTLLLPSVTPVLMAVLSDLLIISRLSVDSIISAKRAAALRVESYYSNNGSGTEGIRGNENDCDSFLQYKRRKRTSSFDGSEELLQPTTAHAAAAAAMKAKVGSTTSTNSTDLTSLFIEPQLYIDLQELMLARLLIGLHNEEVEIAKYASFSSPSPCYSSSSSTHSRSLSISMISGHSSCVAETFGQLLQLNGSLLKYLLAQSFSSDGDDDDDDDGHNGNGYEHERTSSIYGTPTNRCYAKFTGLLRCCSSSCSSNVGSVGRIIWEDCVSCQFTEDDSADANLLPFLEKRFEIIYFYLAYAANQDTSAATTTTSYEYWAQKIARAVPSFILRAYTPLTVFHHVKLIAKLERYRHLLLVLLKQYYPTVALDLLVTASDLLQYGRRSAVQTRSIGLQRVIESIKTTIDVPNLYTAAIYDDGL